MKLRSLFLAAAILALPVTTFAQTPPVAPVTSAPVGGDARMHEAWQRFEQEQAERKEKFEAEQAERAQRFEEMQAKHKAEFEQRMQQWSEKREEHPAGTGRPNIGGAPPVVAPVAPAAPVAPNTNPVQ